MDNLTRHVTLAFRRLLKAPLFTLTAAVTLAVGIGANTSIFSVVNGVLLKPLPYHEPEDLLGLWNSAPGLGFDQLNQSEALYFKYRKDATTVEDVALWAVRGAQISGTDQPEQLRALRVTHTFLPILRVAPAAGRVFSESDDLPGAPATVMIGYDYWQRSFGGDPSVVGRTLIMNSEPREIIGVLPSGFDFLNYGSEILYPSRANEAEAAMGNFSYQMIGRLSPGNSITDVTLELDRLAWEAVDEYPGPVARSMLEQAQFSTLNRPLKEDLVGDVRPVLWVLLGTVGMVLLIACANVANLFLVRAEGRVRDVAVRTALGASRGEITRQFLAESLVLGLLGGVVGIGLAFIGLEVLTRTGPEQLPRLSAVGVDGTVLLFTLGISLMSGVLFGVLPLLRYGRPNLVPALKEGGRGGAAGKDRRRAQSTLVIAQIALALVLLVGSGLMIRSFQALRNVDPGYNAEDVLTFSVNVPSALVEGAEATLNTFQQMEASLRAIPGVVAVGTSSAVPMSGNESNDPVFIEGVEVAEGELPPIRRFSFVLPGFFDALEIPIVAGRDLELFEVEQGLPVVVVAETFAKENWGTAAEAIGRRIGTIQIGSGERSWHQIVGVVGDVHQDGLDQEPPSLIYWPVYQQDFYGEGPSYQRYMVFSVRTQPGADVGLLERAQAAIWGVAASVPLAQVQTLGSLLEGSMARTSFTLIMLGIAAAVALLLGAIGIYGVISYAVSLRTREIGVRMALGAQKGDVSTMVLRQGLTLAGLGVVVGLVAAFGLSRLMSSLLFGVEPLDPITYLTVCLALTSVALLACWLPAQRAGRLDPATMLREE